MATVPPLRSVRLLDGVCRGWIELLKSDEMSPVLNDCCGRVDASTTSEDLEPRPELVFESLRYFSPKATRVIIIGEEPYSTKYSNERSYSPDGLAFSGNPRDSFRNISAASGMQDCDLSAWAVQGVLLLNAYLTKNKGDPKKKHEFWLPLTQKIVNHAIKSSYKRRMKKSPVDVFMWGKTAEKLKITVKNPKKYRIHTWCHPSPLSTLNNPGQPGRFELCDHFGKVDYVQWNVGRVLIAATDGAMKGNGKVVGATETGTRNSTGGSGVVLPKNIRGAKNRMVDGGSGAQVTSYTHKPPPSSGGKYTNNAAEAYAVLCALRMMAKRLSEEPDGERENCGKKVGTACVVVTDSNVSIHAVENESYQANAGIFDEILVLKREIEKTAKLVMLYQPGHTKPYGRYALSDIELLNNAADEAANAAERE